MRVRLLSPPWSAIWEGGLAPLIRVAALACASHFSANGRSRMCVCGVVVAAHVSGELLGGPGRAGAGREVRRGYVTAQPLAAAAAVPPAFSSSRSSVATRRGRSGCHG